MPAPRLLLPLAAAALVALGAAPGTASAAAKPSCTRGGATAVAVSPSVKVVRVKAPRSEGQTRHVKLLACRVRTGARRTIADLADRGLDNIASATVEIVDDRYVGVRERNEGGVSESVVARVFDARRGRLLHTSRPCDELDQGDFGGVDDAVFLEDGGMAFSCGRLFLFRRAGAALEQLEPDGTDVRQLAVSRDTRGFSPVLFWIVATPEGETAKSLAVQHP